MIDLLSRFMASIGVDTSVFIPTNIVMGIIITAVTVALYEYFIGMPRYINQIRREEKRRKGQL